MEWWLERKNLRGRNLGRWIFAVQVRLFCVTDSGSVLFCVKLSRLKAVVQVSSGGYLGRKGWRDFFPCSVHTEYRMILSCKAACLWRLQFCKSINTSSNLVNHLSPFFLYSIIPYHEFFLCFALTGFICSKQWEFPPVPLGNYYEVQWVLL